MVGSLWETLLDSFCDVPPFAEGEMHLFGVLALFPGNCAQEGDHVVGNVVLDSGAVPDGVDITQRCSD